MLEDNQAHAHRSAMVRGAAHGAPAGASEAALSALPQGLRQSTWAATAGAMARDPAPAVRAAACKAAGCLAALPLALQLPGVFTVQKGLDRAYIRLG